MLGRRVHASRASAGKIPIPCSRQPVSTSTRSSYFPLPRSGRFHLRPSSRRRFTTAGGASAHACVGIHHGAPDSRRRLSSSCPGNSSVFSISAMFSSVGSVPHTSRAIDSGRKSIELEGPRNACRTESSGSTGRLGFHTHGVRFSATFEPGSAVHHLALPSSGLEKTPVSCELPAVRFLMPPLQQGQATPRMDMTVLVTT